MDISLKEANKIIGSSFKNIRKAHKLTQEEIAEKIDVTPEYLSKFENGKYNASIYNIILLCKAIKTTPTKILKPFFEDDENGVIESIVEELKELALEDQKMILEIINRFKK